jgi:hypothetical protein
MGDDDEEVAAIVSRGAQLRVTLKQAKLYALKLDLGSAQTVRGAARLQAKGP